jgi:zinc transport system substrate-binding protein
VEALLPPEQCPGHYDMKLSDVEKLGRADLVIAFADMPPAQKGGRDGARLLVETGGRNWMVPDYYLHGLSVLTGLLAARYPQEKDAIRQRERQAAARVRGAALALKQRIARAGVAGKPVVASSMQRELLEWMGLTVVAAYGRPEAMSAREAARLVATGRERRAVLVAATLQSGPDAGRGIAEALRAPHVVLTNFPADEGYIAALEGNVNAVLAALDRTEDGRPGGSR